MLQVTCPSAIHSAGVPSGKLSVDLFKAIADDFAADGEVQIFNLLWVGVSSSYMVS